MAGQEWSRRANPIDDCCRERPTARGDRPRAAKSNIVSIGGRHHLDPRHHATVLVLEDVAVVDEFSKLGERDVENLRVRVAMAVAPLRYRADAVLVVEDLVLDAGVGHRHTERKIILRHAAIAAGHHKSRLMQMKIVVFRRQLNELPGLVYRSLTR